MAGEGRRIIARGRRGTLVLSCGHRLSEQEFDEFTRSVRRALHVRPGVLLLDGDVTIEGVIAVTPSPRWRGRGHRPRWVR
jgi:hypothetical protein